MNIKDLKEYINKGSIMWTTHCLERMSERNIKRFEVKNCILNGEIIEEYPNDFPNPSCLIFGVTVENKCLHVIVGYDDENIYIITTYYPTTDKFKSDLKIRRK